MAGSVGCSGTRAAAAALTNGAAANTAAATHRPARQAVPKLKDGLQAAHQNDRHKGVGEEGGPAAPHDHVRVCILRWEQTKEQGVALLCPQARCLLSSTAGSSQLPSSTAGCMHVLPQRRCGLPCLGTWERVPSSPQQQPTRQAAASGASLAIPSQCSSCPARRPAK